jgi:hypothetical protein
MPQTGEEAMWLWEGGMSREQIAKAMNVQVASIERAFMRSDLTIPWSQKRFLFGSAGDRVKTLSVAKTLSDQESSSQDTAIDQVTTVDSVERAFARSGISMPLNHSSRPFFRPLASA